MKRIYAWLLPGAVAVAISVCLTVVLLLELLGGSGGFRGTHYDFLAFYSTAWLALHGHIAQVFDATALTQLQRTIVPHAVGAAGYMPFLNPPFFAVILAPLALMPVFSARLVWFIINAALVGLLVCWITKPLVSWRRLVAISMLVCTAPIYQALIEGQPSLLLLAAVIGAYVLAAKHRLAFAGTVLAILWIKPQFAIFAIIGLLVAKQWRALQGMAIASLAVLATTLPFTGVAPYITYVHYMLGVVTGHFAGAGAVGQTTWQGALNWTTGINGFYAAIFGQANVLLVNGFLLVTTAGLVALWIIAIKKYGLGWRTPRQKLVLAGSIMLALLVDPHLYAQDCVLLYAVLPLLYAGGWRLRTTIVVALACNVILLDQYLPVHIFTLLVVCFVVATFTLPQKWPPLWRYLVITK